MGRHCAGRGQRRKHEAENLSSLGRDHYRRGLRHSRVLRHLLSGRRAVYFYRKALRHPQARALRSCDGLPAHAHRGLIRPSPPRQARRQACWTDALPEHPCDLAPCAGTRVSALQHPDSRAGRERIAALFQSRELLPHHLHLGHAACGGQSLHLRACAHAGP